MKLFKLFALDFWCFFKHSHQTEGDGYHLCGCGREWKNDCCVSRDWKGDMMALTMEVPE